MKNIKVASLHLLSIALVLFSLCPTSNSQNNIPPELQATIDAFVTESFLPTSGTNGLGLAIVQGDGALLYTAGYGMANQAKQIPMTSSSQFITGSISKSVTATMATKILHEKWPELGEGVLDTPIQRLLPEVNFTLSDRYRSEYVTFRDLLSHQVCVGTNDMAAAAGAIKSHDEAIYRARYAGEVCRIRTSSVAGYNNLMIETAGYLAAKIVNKTYEEAIRDFFDELGMVNSTVVMESDDPEKMPNRAMPHYVQDGQIFNVNYGLTKRLAYAQASGGVVVTPDDMVRYMRFHMNKGELDGVQIVPPHLVDWIHRPSILWPGYGYKNSDTDIVMNTFGYGLGMWLGSVDGWQLLQHGGSAPPFLNLMAMGPGLKIGIYAALNMSPTHADIWSLHFFIMEILRGIIGAEERAQKRMGYIKLKEEQRKMDEDAQNLFKMETNACKAEAEEPVGNYGNGVLGDLKISEKLNEERNQTEYFMEYGRWYQGWLIPREEDNVYNLEWTTDVFQDNLILGQPREGNSYIVIEADKATLIATAGFGGVFMRGESLDTLPHIPWAEDSCGP